MPRKNSRSSLSDLQRQIIANIEKGHYLDVAAGMAGVSPRLAAEWMARGAEDESAGREDSLYLAFRRAVLQAQASIEASLLEVVSAAAQEGKWQAASWLLERLRPRRYQKRTGWVQSVKASSEQAPLRVVSLQDVARLEPGGSGS